ncbi:MULTISPECIES: hypothetical protein [Sporosarcina]|uniref:hypothetical protein n=1 Tax=Sporosarcina TaxID=1569 RepID=UPI000ADB9FFF|nr:MULTISPECIES: hypothetical protein [Sporosarcina]WJY26580.1 hypothetical protein QWT68_10860 [Sporosarcina sp. 0.2-SM1T-5]
MEYTEDTAVELKDGRRGVILLVRADEPTRYDIELTDGEITTVFHDEIAAKDDFPVK